MDIKRLVNIWQRSKYNNLFIHFIDCVRDDKEIVKPMGYYHKGEEIIFGKKMKIEEHLIDIYSNSIFYISKAEDNEIEAFEIMKKSKGE